MKSACAVRAPQDKWTNCCYTRMRIIGHAIWKLAYWTHVIAFVLRIPSTLVSSTPPVLRFRLGGGRVLIRCTYWASLYMGGSMHATAKGVGTHIPHPHGSARAVCCTTSNRLHNFSIRRYSASSIGTWVVWEMWTQWMLQRLPVSWVSPTVACFNDM